MLAAVLSLRLLSLSAASEPARLVEVSSSANARDQTMLAHPTSSSTER